MTRCALPLLLSIAAGLWAQPAPGPVNLDFRDSELGQLPKGWFAPGAAPGFRAEATDQCSKAGNRCAVLRWEKAALTAVSGNLLQYVDAARYRSRQVRFRASIRTEKSGLAGARLWMRADCTNGRIENMGERWVDSPEWRPYELNSVVSDDAVMVQLGVMLRTSGESAVWIDNVSFEITGEVPPAPLVERSRPLAGRGLENLTAFARLYGYVRHFHPSSEAAAADWNALAISGVPAVENASDPADLARKLEAYFRPAAPTVRVITSAETVPQLELARGTKMISWKHHGFGGGGGGPVYWSERVTADPPGGRLPAPFVADLGGSVKAVVPLALFADQQFTVPGEASRAERSARKIRYTANDRATRIGAVIIAWNILQHFYPYFDVVQTDWPKALQTALRSAATDRDEKEFVVTLRRLLAALKDGHGWIMARPDITPAPLGWEWIESRVVITAVPDAQGQAIERGDAVVSVNGTPVAQALASIEPLCSAATPQFLRFRALNELGFGPADQPLVLEIEPFREPGRRRTVTLKRQAGSTRPPLPPRPERIAELKPGIMYIDLTRISDADWQMALPRLEKVSGIVFDLRGYPSLGTGWLTYLSDKPMTSAQWYVPEITAPDHNDMRFTRSQWTLTPHNPYLKAKRAVLTDGRAISYAETTMGIVEHYGLAEIVGGATAGTNGNVNPVPLPGGYTIRWTGMKVLKHDGSQHHGIAIKPTIPVSPTREGIAAGRDEVLERGIQTVQ